MTRHIALARVHNFRDLGGYRTAGGQTVRWGRLFRSDSLGKLQGDDWRRFLGLDVRTVVDLRYPFEIEAKGRVPAYDGLEYHNLSIEHRPYDQPGLGPDVEPGRYLADRFGEVAHDGVKEIRRVLEIVADDGTAPLVFHCTSGKDRTGLIAALLLSLVGVSEDDIVADFTLTDRATDRLVADWKAENPHRELVWPAYGRAPAEVMRLFLADLHEAYGSVRGYAAQRLDADDHLITTLRHRLLTETPASPSFPKPDTHQ